MSFAPGFRYGRFLVERAREVPELKCRLIELRHSPSGAQVLHIENDDPENFFCLSFRTLPYSSNGIAHILEHLSLCGSKSFPVRDPFFSMTRRSMNTFMNALTGTDFTCYPAASQIKQDFYNLLSVYADAVFHPLLSPLSFTQEGHRFEFAEKESACSPLTINGVVYNEMKGANVNPTRRLIKEMNAQLFPNTSYGFDSGGDPKEIPSLTLEELAKFHKTYYHPSRCLFFFYGSFPLSGHLDFLEEKVLHQATALPPLPPVPRQKKLSASVVQSCQYPLPAGESPDRKAYIAYGWLTADITNIEECLALTLLDIMLLETDASPLKYQLLKSGHCRQVLSSCDTEMPESALQTYADELLELKGLKSIRIPDGMWRWIAANAPEGVKKWWRWLFGGWPDNLILIPCGKYLLAVPIELKTQDKKGRAVGALHGKQKHNAEAEKWTIARSPEAFRGAVERAEKDAEKINKILFAQTD